LEIEATCSLEDFREFLIISTCQSFIPNAYIHDLTVFPERVQEQGTMYVESEDKATLKKIGNIQFVKVTNVLGIIYTSKTGNTRLKWRCIDEGKGKVRGEASGNSLVNLFQANVLREENIKNNRLKRKN
jgi:hypothetical protein